MPRNNSLAQRAHTLRMSPTLAERKLWFGFLYEYELPFRQQKVIGPYIVDFFCNTVRLSIELDGSQHYEKEHARRDEIRTIYLETLEIVELRFPNTALWENFTGVCEEIHRVVQMRRNDIVHIPLSRVKDKS